MNRWFLTFLIFILISGCANNSNSTRRKGAKETSDFFWPYAAIATDIYAHSERTDARNTRAIASPWLRAEVTKRADDPAVQARYNGLFEDQLRDEVSKGQLQSQSSPEEGQQKLEGYTPQIPTRREDCEPTDPEVLPSVPLNDAMDRYGWQHVPEVNFGAATRAWTLFVPDLALELWRRNVPQRVSTIEYAIVYRGTIGTGGWWSNLRNFTAIPPLVWDQYRQSRRITQDIVRKILDLHKISDVTLYGGPQTTVLITAVGHSLGAGIASYIYYVVPEVTRMVGFDPSPVDGSGTISTEEKMRVMTIGGARRDETTYELPADKRSRLDEPRPFESDGAPEAAQMFLLFEKGDFLSRFFPCKSGPVWPGISGPVQSCEHVNFLGGNWVDQHNMARLACMLYLSHIGYPTLPPRADRSQARGFGFGTRARTRSY